MVVHRSHVALRDVPLQSITVPVNSIVGPLESIRDARCSPALTCDASVLQQCPTACHRCTAAISPCMPGSSAPITVPLNRVSALAKGSRVVSSSPATRVRNLSAEIHRGPALHCVSASPLFHVVGAETTATHPIPRAHVPRGDRRRNGACTARFHRSYVHILVN
jgi:hypothetical protein